MKGILKILMRLVIVIAVVIIVLFFINSILSLKHKYKNVEKIEWDWNNENEVITRQLNDKFYIDEKTGAPTLIMKNEVIPEKTNGEKRILIIGDSYVFGQGLKNVNYTWWKQLNLRIKEAGYSNVNIYGLGKYRYNTQDELDKYLNNEELINRINPDLIIIGYVPNDPEEHAADNFHNLVPDSWEIVPEENEIYKKNPNLYYELVDRMNAIGIEDEEKLREMGEILGYYRWDMRCLVIAEGENLKKYKNVLFKVDKKIKEYDVPYFYYFTDNYEMPLTTKANNNVYKTMKEMKIKAYYEKISSSDLFKKINSNDREKIEANPVDGHPGIVWNYEASKRLYAILKKDYKFIFEDPVISDINELELNINDTMPFLEVNKLKNNVYEFEYPKDEVVRTENTKFLYYPIEKEYVKLNLEYPKDVKKIIVTGFDLESVEIYVNAVDSKLGFDVDEAFQKVTTCKKINNNTYKVNKKITSVNIHAEFKSNNSRKIKIEFIE